MPGRFDSGWPPSSVAGDRRDCYPLQRSSSPPAPLRALAGAGGSASQPGGCDKFENMFAKWAKDR